MDPWKSLEKKINEAKDRAIATDRVLDRELLTRCKVCGGRMAKAGSTKLKCTLCGTETETNRAKIKRALEEHGRLTAHELAEITGVPRDEIGAYLDDGFLEVNRNSNHYLTCKMCGIKISNGTVCEKCKSLYQSDFGKVNVRTGNTIGRTEKTVEETVKSQAHFMNRRR